MISSSAPSLSPPSGYHMRPVNYSSSASGGGGGVGGGGIGVGGGAMYASYALSPSELAAQAHLSHLHSLQTLHGGHHGELHAPRFQFSDRDIVARLAALGPTDQLPEELLHPNLNLHGYGHRDSPLLQPQQHSTVPRRPVDMSKGA
jgi:hypothetical protein